MKKPILFFFVAVGLLSCKKSVSETDTEPNQTLSLKSVIVANTPYSPNNPILKNANTDFEIGAAINEGKFSNSLYTGLAGSQYNSITAENQMKFANIQATQNVFTFGTDVTNFAKSKGINRVHGHAIMWYSGVPAWVTNAGGTATGETRKQIYRSILYNHINKVFTFYYGQKDANGAPLIKSWDVVNEAFNDDGSYRSTASNVWARELGGGYEAVRLAFLYARQIAEGLGDTNLKLFYNDYGHEYSNAKTDAIYAMVNTLKAITYNNKPIIDGVGLQMHTSNTRTVYGDNSIYYGINKMSQTGLLVHISELDVKLSGGTVADQDYRWNIIPKIFIQTVPSAQRWGITMWNIGDSDNWQGTAAAATLYAASTYAKKSAYTNFYNGLYQ